MNAKTQKEYDEILGRINYKPLTLRPYQQDCVDAIMAQPKGTRSLVVMATGLGKTGTFTHLPKESGRTLIVAAGKEIVLNPIQYYEDKGKVAIEMGDFHAKEDVPDAQVVTASIQTLAQPKRLQAFDPKEFQTIIIDEAHHSTAKTYKRVIDYFEPDRLIGFTATANRSDGARLDSVYKKVVYQRDLKWAIKNGFLTDILLRKVKGDFDLRNIRAKKSDGDSVADFTDADLAKVMAKSAPAIVKIYEDYATGPTIINVAGVALAHEIADMIPNAIAITGDMPMDERQEILNAFATGKVRVLCNVGVLKEGVDLPCVSTVIMCRPTLSSLLYTQLVGRGLRPYEGKDYLNLIEVEGILGEGVTLCSAPSLFGIDLKKIPKKEQKKFDKKRLTQMEKVAEEIMEEPENWLFSTETAQAWADTEGYDMMGVCWMVMPDGHFELSFPSKKKVIVKNKDGKPHFEDGKFRLILPSPDILGRITLGHTRMPLQVALDVCREHLMKAYKEYDIFWDNEAMAKKWGSKPATERQIALIKKFAPDMDVKQMNSAQASQIISKHLRPDDDDGRLFYIHPIDEDNPPPHYSAVETVSVEGKPFEVFDYSVDPDLGYIEDANREELMDEFIDWLARVIDEIYYVKVCHGDMKRLITNVLNKKSRESMVKGFLRSKEGEIYRYLTQINGLPISRMELIELLAEQADIMLPLIVQHRFVDGNIVTSTLCDATLRMDEEPMKHIIFMYPHSAERVKDKTAGEVELNKTLAELKEEDKRRWLEKQEKKAAKDDTKTQQATAKKKPAKPMPKKAKAGKAKKTDPSKRGN